MFDSEVDNGLAKTVDFINSILNESSEVIVDESDSEEMNKIVMRNSIQSDSYRTFDPDQLGDSQKSFKLAAVDGGSHKILDAGSFILGTYRAGYLIFQDGKLVEDKIGSIKPQFISFSNLREIYSKIFTKLIGDTPVEYPRQLHVVLERLRTFSEWERVQELVEKLDDGDIILIDGSLKASINRLDVLFQSVLEKAVDKGIHFIGISKRSTLRLNHMPLIPKVKKVGETQFAKKYWYCQIFDKDPTDVEPEDVDADKGSSGQQFGKRYIVKYHPLTRFVFRTDVNRLDKTDPDLLFSKIGTYSSDPSYLGYPYPLADIHNQVVITRALRDDMVYRLQGIAMEKGIGLGDWEDLFVDFHRILDMNV
jgi:hypothetical protein